MKQLVYLIILGSIVYGGIYLWKHPELTPRLDKPGDNFMSKWLFKDEPDVSTIVQNGEVILLKDHTVHGAVTIFDFYADWNPSCRKLSPKLKEFAKNTPNIYLRIINIKNINSPVCKKYRIRAVPSVWIFDTLGEVTTRNVSNFNAIKHSALAQNTKLTDKVAF